MRPAFLLSALTGFIGSTSAIITGIAAPSQIGAGATVRITITTANYIQSVQDIAIAFGLAPRNNYHAGSLWQLLSSKYLGPDDSNVLTNISHVIKIPESQQKGDYVLAAELFSLYGAGLSGSLQNFAVNVTVANYTNGDLVWGGPVASDESEDAQKRTELKRRVLWG